jgi:hypothetical protein
MISAGNGLPLTSDSITQTCQLLHWGDKQPEVTLTLSGFQDEPVRIEMFHVMGKSYGGHLHKIEAKYLGEFRCDPPGLLVPSPSVGAVSMVLPPSASEVKIIYRASDVCTRRKLRVSSPALQQPVEIIVDVKYAVQLYDLHQYDTPNLELYTGDDVHPEEVSHYGTRAMIDALVAIDRAFREAVRNGDLPADTPIIKVNDMSLPWGGSLRIYGDMLIQSKDGSWVTNSHKTHKWGTDVDISYNAMTTSKQRTWFKTEASKHFTTVDIHNKGESQQHWHLDL